MDVFERAQVCSMGSTVYPPTSAYSSYLLVAEIFPSLPKKPLEVDNGDDGFGKKASIGFGLLSC